LWKWDELNELIATKMDPESVIRSVPSMSQEEDDLEMRNASQRNSNRKLYCENSDHLPEILKDRDLEKKLWIERLYLNL
jgi:hypothetical protein